jgi:hypothetical protein
MFDFHASEQFVNIKPIDNKPLKIEFSNGEVIIKRPSLEEYLKFESEFAVLLSRFLPLFRGVGFLTTEELENNSMKVEFFRQLGIAFKNVIFLRFFKGFLKSNKKLFTFSKGLKPSNLQKKLTLSEIMDIFVSCHCIILAEKKNSQKVLEEMLGMVLSDYSIFSRKNSVGGVPRYSPPK